MKYPKYIKLNSMLTNIINKKPIGDGYLEIDLLSDGNKKLKRNKGLWIGLYSSEDKLLYAFYEVELIDIIKNIKKLK
jgi:hypothetical protein